MFGLSDGALGAESDVARAAVAASTDDVNTMAEENLKPLQWFLCTSSYFSFTFRGTIDILFVFVKIDLHSA